MQREDVLLRISIMIKVTPILLSIVLLCSPRGAVAEPVPATRIGLVLSMTGIAASFGERTLRGVKLAQEEINKEGALHLEIVTEDSMSQATKAVAAARKLISSDKVNIIIGDVRSDLVLTMAPITEQNKVLLFTTVAGAEEISGAGDFVFRNFEGNLSHGTAMGEYLSKNGLRRVGIFVAQASNSMSFSRGFRKGFEVNSGHIVETIEYLPSETDFRASIAKVLSRSPDGIYVAPTMGGDGGLIVKQVRDAGFSGVIAGGLPIESVEFLDSAGSAAEGVIFSSPAFDEESSKVRSFKKRFSSKFNVSPEWVEANGYDALMLIAEGIKRCGGARTGCIRDFLYNTQGYPGVSGITSFDKNGDVSKSLIIRIVRNRTFRKVDTR